MLSDRDERRTRPRPRGSNRARERAPRGGRRRRARHDGPFDLDGAQLTEIEARMAEADGGDVEPAAAVIEKLRRR
jgi:hypothetical protein